MTLHATIVLAVLMLHLSPAASAKIDKVKGVLGHTYVEGEKPTSITFGATYPGGVADTKDIIFTSDKALFTITTAGTAVTPGVTSCSIEVLEVQTPNLPTSCQISPDGKKITAKVNGAINANEAVFLHVAHATAIASLPPAGAVSLTASSTDTNNVQDTALAVFYTIPRPEIVMYSADMNQGTTWNELVMTLRTPLAINQPGVLTSKFSGVTLLATPFTLKIKADGAIFSPAAPPASGVTAKTNTDLNVPLTNIESNANGKEIKMTISLPIDADTPVTFSIQKPLTAQLPTAATAVKITLDDIANDIPIRTNAERVTASCDGGTKNHVFHIDVPVTKLNLPRELCTGFADGEHKCSADCSADNAQVCTGFAKVGKPVGSGSFWLDVTCAGGTATDYKVGQYSPTCFPGEALVHIEGSGQSFISDLRVGDRVLSAQGHETVLGFLHQARGGSNSFLTVSHSDGEFRATANHLVFAAEGSKAVGDLRVGEEVFVSPSAPPSQILKVRESTSSLGMFSPLTASGTVVVDGLVASIYGQPSMRGKLTHGSAHAAFFPVRAYHALGLTRVFGRSQNDELHPFAELLFPLQLFLSK